MCCILHQAHCTCTCRSTASSASRRTSARGSSSRAATAKRQSARRRCGRTWTRRRASSASRRSYDTRSRNSLTHFFFIERTFADTRFESVLSSLLVEYLPEPCWIIETLKMPWCRDSRPTDGMQIVAAAHTFLPKCDAEPLSPRKKNGAYTSGDTRAVSRVKKQLSHEKPGMWCSS